jgi:ATP-dependent Clp protease ATP-binding subunit ClpX
MEQILLSTMFDLPGLDGVEEVVINREVAESRSNPLYLYGKERAENTA